MSNASTEFATVVANAQKQTIASIKQVQDASLKATRAAVGLVPAEGVSAVSFPSPRTVVESTFAFAGEVLDLQRAYALELADIVAEGTGKVAKKADSAQK
jgi:hypothetical protein